MLVISLFLDGLFVLARIGTGTRIRIGILEGSGPSLGYGHPHGFGVRVWMEEGALHRHGRPWFRLGLLRFLFFGITDCCTVCFWDGIARVGGVWIREFGLDQSGLLSWAGEGVLESRLPSLSSALFGLGGFAAAASDLFSLFLFSLLRVFCGLWAAEVASHHVWL